SHNTVKLLAMPCTRASNRAWLHTGKSYHGRGSGISDTGGGWIVISGGLTAALGHAGLVLGKQLEEFGTHYGIYTV
ncbi:hypothetical protein HDU78_004022, partial [Chytriomyces hyalinus]